MIDTDHQIPSIRIVRVFAELFSFLLFFFFVLFYFIQRYIVYTRYHYLNQLTLLLPNFSLVLYTSRLKNKYNLVFGGGKGLISIVSMERLVETSSHLTFQLAPVSTRCLRLLYYVNLILMLIWLPLLLSFPFKDNTRHI